MKTALIDLSAIFRRFWHASDSEEMNFARRKTLGLVRGLYSDFDNVNICVDCPPYKRKEIYPEYKANRGAPPPLVMEELSKCKKDILADGWTLLTCQGAEADDIIATYCIQSHPEEEIVVFGCDKDLLQLAISNVSIYDPFANKELSAMDKFGVEPSQVVDFLALWGDSSDNIPGVPGIGENRAAEYLNEYGNIKGIYERITSHPGDFTPKRIENFKNSIETLRLAVKLIRLDANCEIVEEKMSPEDKPKNTEGYQEEDAEFTEDVPRETTQAPPEDTAIQTVEPTKHIIKHEEVSYSKALEPMSTEAAWKLAVTLWHSGIFDKFRNEKQAFAAIIRGRSLGIDAVTSLEEISIVKGKAMMSAVLMTGLCLRSDVCEYFELVSSDATQATYVTKRKGNRKETTHTFTIEDADALNLTAPPKPGKMASGWHTQRPNMLRHRCATALSRIVYPDIVAGVYTPDEMEDFR